MLISRLRHSPPPARWCGVWPVPPSRPTTLPHYRRCRPPHPAAGIAAAPHATNNAPSPSTTMTTRFRPPASGIVPTTMTTATTTAIGATSSSLQYRPSLHYHLPERTKAHVPCSCVSSSSTRRCRPPAPALPHATTAGFAAAARRACASARSHVAARHRRHPTSDKAQQFALCTRARTCTRLLCEGLESLVFLAQDWRRWARCARTATLPLYIAVSIERSPASLAPCPCSTHAAFFLFLRTFVIFWLALFSFPFRGTRPTPS